jgi:hypothetical protein
MFRGPARDSQELGALVMRSLDRLHSSAGGSGLASVGGASTAAGGGGMGHRVPSLTSLQPHLLPLPQLSLGRNMGAIFREALRASLYPVGGAGSAGGAGGAPGDGADGGEGGPHSGGAGAAGAGGKPKKEYPKLRMAHFAACLDSGLLDVERAFNLFDTNGDLAVARDEFIHAFEGLWTNL